MGYQKQKVTPYKIQKALEQAGLGKEIQADILGRLVKRPDPRGEVGRLIRRKKVRLDRPTLKRFKKAIQADGLAGIFVSSHGKVHIIYKKHLKIVGRYNFQDKETVKKAVKKRMEQINGTRPANHVPQYLGR